MAYDFPSSPTTGQVFAPSGASGPSYMWNGYAWSTVPPGALKPTRTVLTSGSGTYSTPVGVAWIEVELCGGGAGGSNGASPSTGGTSTTFGPLTGGGATGVGAASNSGNAPGGTASGGQINIPGGPGQGGDIGNTNAGGTGGTGGTNPFGGAGGSGYAAGSTNGINGTGAGGGGGSLLTGSLSPCGTGGGAGGYVRHIFTSPAATYPYAVGVGGTGAPPQAGAWSTGGRGGDGIIIVTEYSGGGGGGVCESGARVLIQAQTVSSPVAQIDFTIGIDATYDEYELRIFNVKGSIQDVGIIMRVSFDAGATWKTDQYQYVYRVTPVSSTANDNQFSAQGGMWLGPPQSNVANVPPFQTIIRAFRLWDTTQQKHFMHDSMGYNQATYGMYRATGGCNYYGATNAINGIRFYPSSGNFTQGTFKLFGIVK